MTALIPAGQLFDEALAAAARGAPSVVQAWAADGSSSSLALQSWCEDADAVDRSALERFSAGLPRAGTVLDIGCGPGRHAAQLNAIGFCVLGVDVSTVAVQLTRARGLPGLCLDALGPLPAVGGWDGLLLLDGNIGIGGHPRRLLRQTCRMLTPTGRVLIELDPGPVTDSRWLQLHDGRQRSGPFRWGRLSAAHLHTLIHRDGMTVIDQWSAGSRHFAVLTKTAIASVRDKATSC